MKSVVEVDVNLAQAKLAALFVDPRHSTKWMDDLDRYEAISGEPGMPGSQYRLVPRKGNMVFVATVVARALPNEARLTLEGPNVTVSVRGRFLASAPGRTRLISEEEFSFKGPLHKALGIFARRAIKKAHRRHMEAFKRFAESHG